MPRIVVMVGAYNEEQYLGETIPAILNQTMLDFGLLLLDNGSTDSTGAMLDGFASYDDRVIAFHSPVNLPPGEAFNFLHNTAQRGFHDCRWFLSHGADDVMAPNYLECILDAAQANPNANLIFSPWQWLDEPDNGVKIFPDFDPETCHAVHQIPAWHAATRELWESSGGHDETLIGSDWDWVARNRHAIRPVQLEQPMLSLRIRHGKRKSQSNEVHWPSLHKHLCGIVGKPAPDWAERAIGVC